ncbi:DNA-3-methyladenine glycosylase [Protofrankia symbiont of Coriaria ruscifolia]|uniref:Putative 3-methyladenine DNA glycosylase n=1 Tax=Candidatus Protofrankia californiensis TaxID=1839754 RepID=A0A1C3P962_9ACTN|nr:DNA-3-methyladenine glycosylase [Protofrankia symbiont of Coriaria ruscifolia]SBW26374.1 3-methyladenine DNA glycosylase [Candidatus Protofrankia californiensis]
MGGRLLSVPDWRFYDRPPLDVARDLLGARLRRGGVVVRLTEVEAYGGEDDPASHAFHGLTPRCAVMFGPPGHLYVYFIYGMHWCMNIVCGPVGEAAAVLLRAGEVVEGADRAARGRSHLDRAALARGPARLTRALAVDGSLNGADLVLNGAGPIDAGPDGAALVGRGDSGGSAALPALSADEAALVLCAGPGIDEARVAHGPRVGVRAAADREWRLWITGELSVSGSRRERRAVPAPAAAPEAGRDLV